MFVTVCFSYLNAQDVIDNVQKINHHLNDEKCGGGPTGGHDLVLAMHLLQQHKSLHDFQAKTSKSINVLQQFCGEVSNCFIHVLAVLVAMCGCQFALMTSQCHVIVCFTNYTVQD